MSNFAVTLLQQAHLSGAAELEKLCFSDPWSEESLSILIRQGGIGIAALAENGAVIGYGGMLTVLDEGQITNIAVHPDFRRQGVGRAVLCALIAQAQKQDISRLSLEVRASNTSAQSLYLQQGFETVGVRKRFYSHPTEDGLVMVRADRSDTEPNRT